MTLQAWHLTQAARSVTRMRRSTESPPSTWPQGKRKLRRPPSRLPLERDAGRPIAASFKSLLRMARSSSREG
jgi:hypothetical protein